MQAPFQQIPRAEQEFKQVGETSEQFSPENPLKTERQLNVPVGII
jgi:hypothetical protein